jgi:hypothetical protein
MTNPRTAIQLTLLITTCTSTSACQPAQDTVKQGRDQAANVLKSLKILFLKQTKVTDAGVADLQEALPDCAIHR